MIARMGSFFIWIGAGLVLLFVLSDIARSPDFRLLLYALLSIALGIFFRFISPAPPPKVNESRFRMLRKRKEQQEQQQSSNSRS